MKTSSNSHPAEVLAGQSLHGHRDGVCFESAFASTAKKPIDGVVLQAALAKRGWSALALGGDPKRPVRKPQTLEATWLVSARHSQAALEAAVAQAVAALPEAEDGLDDWLQAFTQSGQGASFALEHFKGWSAAQWFNQEFGDSDDDSEEDDDDDEEDDDDGTVAAAHAIDVAAKAFAAFPAALQDTLARSRQVYVLRSEQASDEGVIWQPSLADACEAVARALGECTGSVELFERGENGWGYRVW